LNGRSISLLPSLARPEPQPIARIAISRAPMLLVMISVTLSEVRLADLHSPTLASENSTGRIDSFSIRCAATAAGGGTFFALRGRLQEVPR
jgi:hypothetical protein